MVASQKTKKTLNNHWHIAIQDIMAAVSTTVGGLQLSKKIKEFKNIENRNLDLILTCAGCGTAMFFGIDRIYQNHFEPKASAPSISCPSCKSDGDHGYEGIRETQSAPRR